MFSKRYEIYICICICVFVFSERFDINLSPVRSTLETMEGFCQAECFRCMWVTCPLKGTTKNIVMVVDEVPGKEADKVAVEVTKVTLMFLPVWVL